MLSCNWKNQIRITESNVPFQVFILYLCRFWVLFTLKITPDKISRGSNSRGLCFCSCLSLPSAALSGLQRKRRGKVWVKRTHVFVCSYNSHSLVSCGPPGSGKRRSLDCFNASSAEASSNHHVWLSEPMRTLFKLQWRPLDSDSKTGGQL